MNVILLNIPIATTEIMLTKFHTAIVFILTACLIVSFPALSEEQEPLLAELTFEERLKGLEQTLSEKEREKKKLEREVKLEKDIIIKEQLQQDLSSANDIILGLREEVIILSTGGVSLYEEPPQIKTEFDWRKDLELIFEPVLDQLREISDRPRIIEKLEADISYWQGRESQLDLAVNNINVNIELLKSKALKKDLQGLLKSATSRSTAAKQKLSLLRNELSLLKESENPIWKTLSDIFTKIIAGILLHLLIAIAAGFIVFQVVRVLAAVFRKLITKKRGGQVDSIQRAIDVIRILLGSVFAVITYFIVLYGFAEWLLLVLSLLIIAGIMLALKSTLPRYIVEIKTLLNMGSIRQGERIILNGLPWQINRLNVYTRLYNPALQGYLRVPLNQIVQSSSRPYHEDEPWFPTKVDDVVIVDDGTFGKVKRQTPDVVEINLGGSIFSYQATDFLSRRIQNLSREGFSIYEVFGFDYKHQEDITSNILQIYKSEVEIAIKASAYAKYNTSLTLEFDNASASSLDFKIIAAFDGEIADDYFRIKRFIQKTSVDIANKHGWVIPFQQVTVHHQAVE